MPSETIESAQNSEAEPLEDLDIVSLSPDPSRPFATSSVPVHTIPKHPFISYSRKQLLLLSKSPLVIPPPNLPPLKDWFGEWNDQHSSSSKREADSGLHPRERRTLKKDDDDSGNRPSFKSTIGATQPSQMGNFRHQSLRMPSISDRADRDHDREMRDRDGQERLRNLSEKFDRERLALASRREPASRPTASTLPRNTGNRADKREATASKDREKDGKKRSDWNEDWRRGSRDDSADGKMSSAADNGPEMSQERIHTEEGRRRTSGRHRIEPSAETSGELTSQIRKMRLDESSTDPSGEGHVTVEGRRSEKTMNRRRRQQSPTENRQQETEAWDTEKNSRDKERIRARESRRIQSDEDREPAWMQTYDPEKDGQLAGVLGGDGMNGGLDGIQVWKQELKAKEQQEQHATLVDAVHEIVPNDGNNRPPSTEDLTTGDSAQQHTPVDEIAMFKMMMQREQLKTDSNNSPVPELNTQSAVDHPGAWVINQKSASTNSSEITPSHRLDYEPPRQSRILSYGIHGGAQGGVPGSQVKVGTVEGRLPTPRATVPISSTTQPGAMGSLVGTDTSPSLDPNLSTPLNRSLHNEGQRLLVNPLLPQQTELYRSSVATEPNLPIYSSGLNNDTIASPTGTSMRGSSRFAKFFEQKTRENSPATANTHVPPIIQSNSLDYQHPGMLNQPNSVPDNEAFQSMLAMLHNSSRSVLSTEVFQRPSPQSNAAVSFNHNAPQPRVHNYLPPMYSDPPPLPAESRFSPDGLVPGLKPSRTRHTQSDLYDSSRSNEPVLQGYHRGLSQNSGADNMAFHQYSGTHSPSGHRNVNHPSNPAITGTLLPGHSTQTRLPPGLANLGARPPHDPSQMAHNQLALGASIHDTLPVPISDFGISNRGPNLTYRRSPQPSQQMGGSLAHLNAGVGLTGGGMGEDLTLYSGMRPNSNAGYGPQHRNMVGPGVGVRAQQQYQLLSQHGIPHAPASQIMSSHYPSGQGHHGEPRTQNDLMALLLRGGMPQPER